MVQYKESTILRFSCLMKISISLLIMRSGSASIYSQDELKASMLRFLSLEEPPEVSGQEFRSVQVPQSVQARYDELMWKYEGGEKVYERKMRSAEPSLATLFRTAQKSQGISGDVVFSNTFSERLQFDMDGKIDEGASVAFAELKLFKKLPNRQRRQQNRDQQRTPDKRRNRVHLSRRRGGRERNMRKARVSIYHTVYDSIGGEHLQLLDSRMVMVNHSGWQSFDITRAIRQWQRHPVKVMSITFELRVDSARPGRKAAESASLVRFTSQSASPQSTKRPEIVIYTKKPPKPGPSDCSSSAVGKCCRDHRYINFRELEWARRWIVQPSGYDAFQCRGSCSEGRWKFLPRSKPTCSAAKTAPLPIMYLVKRNGVTQLEVAEFPHMVVQECGCSSEGGPMD